MCWGFWRQVRLGAGFITWHHGLRMRCFSSFARCVCGGGDGAVVTFSEHVDYVDVDGIQYSIGIAIQLELNFTKECIPQTR